MLGLKLEGVNMARILVFFLGIMVFVQVTATPKEVVIVRHVDKWNFKHYGPTVDPTGYARAVNLAFYFLNKFGYPDYIVATNPSNQYKYSESIRELQTVAPLVNILAINDINKGGFSILHPYRPPQYALLAKELLKNSKFNDKLVLICWDHFTIPALATKLGVKEKIPTWPKRDFDTVYILKYANNGRLAHFEVLNHQYPTKNIKNWTVVQKALAKAGQ
jgi:hypothetical protein